MNEETSSSQTVLPAVSASASQSDFPAFPISSAVPVLPFATAVTEQPPEILSPPPPQSGFGLFLALTTVMSSVVGWKLYRGLVQKLRELEEQSAKKEPELALRLDDIAARFAALEQQQRIAPSTFCSCHLIDAEDIERRLKKLESPRSRAKK